MAAYSQKEHLLALTTPLGEDALALSGFSGQESLSRLFSFQLDMLSENDAIKPGDLIGKPVTWCIQNFHDEPRYFNGIVSRFTAGDRGDAMRSYRAEVVPWLWLLTRTANCQIFQNQTAPDIIQSVFSAYGFSDFEVSLQASYSQRVYCVQYRETAFNFVSRLMEQEGIFYYFRHEQGKHTLVLCDAVSAYFKAGESTVSYTTASPTATTIDTWEHQYEFRPGKWTQQDYNFETPATSLLSTAPTLLDLPAAKKYEMFDYPGEYGVKGVGDARTKTRMAEDEASYDVVTGTSTCCTFAPAAKFTLQDHEAASENGVPFVLTAVQHSASEGTYGPTARTGGYHNRFSCIPAAVAFRPARLSPKPFVQGPQTAVVVGPAGEEIYTDKYGRVKVQFFWDRKGKKDENSSCWIRVAEGWAGKNWGVIFNPRIGQEVIVDFLEGDPDRPLITGRVYNADQMPPYTLPDNQTQSGIKTRSTKKGGTENFNELRFEDKKDSEDIFFHAEKDFHREVEHDDDLKVGNDQTIEIKNNRTETVKEGNESITIKQGNRDVLIEMGNDSLTLKQGNQTTKLNLGASSTEAMQSITLKVGQNSITVDQTGVTIKGLMISVEGQVQTQIKGLMTQVNADAMLQVKGAITMIN